MERSFGSKYGKWIALTAVVLALVLWFVLSGGVENYRAKYEGYDLSQQIGDIGRSSTYSLYLRAHEGAPDASSDVSIPLVTVDSDGVTAQKDGLLMQSGSSATFAVTVPETGFYNIRLTYRTEAARGVDLERELRINGEVPFDGADTLTFTRLWHDGLLPRFDGLHHRAVPLLFRGGGKHRHPDCDQRADAPDRAFAHRPRKNAGLRRLCRRAATGEQRSC